MNEDFQQYENNVKEKEEAEKKKREEEKRKAEERKWESLGYYRITTYCPGCNDPAGTYQSSSGTTLYEGCVACSWLSIGTRLRIDGYEYVVMDTCGVGGTIDIFVDSGSYCSCNTLSYKEVYIRK